MESATLCRTTPAGKPRFIIAVFLFSCFDHKKPPILPNAYAKLKDPKKREAYYTKHSAEIKAFKDARNYLNAVMNGRTDLPPIKEWRKEQQSLTAAKYAACERYYALQDEVRSVEQLRKGAENIMREDVQERQPRRAQDVEL